jgi:phosphomannomutase
MKKEQLKKSTSGVRGVVGNGLDPLLTMRYAAAFGTMLKKGPVVVGRDSRPSGKMIKQSIMVGLTAVGIDVVDVDVVPTPTVEIAIKELKATGGICVTASHNPAQWNALKFFNARGEFITVTQYKRLEKLYEAGKFAFKAHDKLGSVSTNDSMIERHIQKTLKQRAVNKRAIKKAGLKVVIDAVNGAGSTALPELVERLGVTVIRLNCDGSGKFPHEPEPVPKNLGQISWAVKHHKADLGLVCDPDADRLALVDAEGEPVGEELTLAIAVQEVLQTEQGPTVINLSTSNVTAEAARKNGSKVYLSKVGEANVVELMHKKKAVIGGEGNGGVIFPRFHAGRDSLIAAALVLSALARGHCSLRELVDSFGRYYTVKSKAAQPDDFEVRLKKLEQDAETIMGTVLIDRQDGLRFDFDGGWLQVRSSNTEPIYRLIVESSDQRQTDDLYKKVIKYFR